MTFALKWYYDQKIISFFSSDFESVFATKNKKKPYVGIFTYFSFTIQIGSNWYIDTRLILPDLMAYVAKIYDLGPYMLCKTCIT